MMNFESVRTGLQEYNKQEVNIYCNYLKFLSEDTDSNNQKKNKWFPYFKQEEAIDLYKKVSLDGLFIDGETITLQNKGRVLVSYNYQAYKNKLLNVYPETQFDVQLVCEGDSHDAPRLDAHLSNEECDAVGENPGFPAAWTSKNQDWSSFSGNGSPLGYVQIGKVFHIV